MDRLRCPLLILHGEEDENAPFSQAVLLRDRLTALGKEFEIETYPGEGHGLGPKATTRTIEFFKRRLAGEASKGEREAGASASPAAISVWCG